MLNFLLLVLLVLLGDVHIAPAHRVPNRTGWQCVWSSMETIGRHHGMRDLYNLTEYDGPVNPDIARSIIETRGHKCYWRPRGPAHLEEVQRMLDWHWPVSIEVAWADWPISHMVVVEEVTPEFVRVIDDGHEQKWKREWFDGHWTGRYITIVPTR